MSNPDQPQQLPLPGFPDRRQPRRAQLRVRHEHEFARWLRIAEQLRTRRGEHTR